jgi:hypothetical protein
MGELTQLTIENLQKKAGKYIDDLSASQIKDLYGVTDGKAVGTYVEHEFQARLHEQYEYIEGSSASGIDFPELGVDLKVTASTQPQSSCPFKSAEQKVYGLGYHLLVFVYNKTDDDKNRAANLDIKHGIFIYDERTADFQTTKGIREIIERNGNKDDLIGFFEERMLPLDEIGKNRLAERVLEDPPKQGYLTISNALQWRLQYSRPIKFAAKKERHGVVSVLA